MGLKPGLERISGARSAEQRRSTGGNGYTLHRDLAAGKTSVFPVVLRCVSAAQRRNLKPTKTGRRTGDDPPPLRRSEVKPQTELHVARSVAGAIDSAEGARRGDAQCRTTHDGVVHYVGECDR